MLAVIIESVGNRGIYYGHHEDLIRKQESHRKIQCKETSSEVNHYKGTRFQKIIFRIFHRLLSQNGYMPKRGKTEV